MKWIYGKQDWRTYERGQENCFLMTNGLGGFSSLTMTGSVARNDHALFMACLKAPNHRYNMVHRLREELTLGQERYTISSQEFADKSREKGYRYLSEFSYEDTPVWRFDVSGIEIQKEAAMRQGENMVVLSYRIKNRTGRDAVLSVTPFYQFTAKGNQPEEDQRFTFREGDIESRGLTMRLETDGTICGIPEETETYFYSYDACDGRRKTGRAKAIHRIDLKVEAGKEREFGILFKMAAGEAPAKERENTQERTGTVAETAASVAEELKNRRRRLEKEAGFTSPLAGFLSRSADQFVSKRASTDGKTILAGFPFFEDWGRDTMIALPGVCISTGRFDTARSILRTFAQYEQGGLMPNLFPEGKNDPMYNTVDAALLFINCIWVYMEASGDLEFVREMYPVMERIVEGYRRGTKYSIRMGADGLIRAGSGFDQVTWMDVRVGEILPTPRHGKPVEINAYWYNALRIMGELSRTFGKNAEEYDTLAEQVKDSFVKNFWMEEKHCLKDVVSGTQADTQIRCNQIWAVSMPFTMLEPEREAQVVDTVFEKLYTPYGLRTLDPEDPQFHPFYDGEVMERDMAYHQGTVWVFPLGAYYLAYLKVKGYNTEAKEYVRDRLEVLESAMREGCIGQLPEIYDGEIPTSSKGCFAQAWSVGEMLRVFEKLEKDSGMRGSAV